MTFTLKDLRAAIITGLTTGVLAWQIFTFLDIVPLGGIGIANPWFVVLVPVLWILGVKLGYFLGRWLPFFNQFGRFAAIGFTNAAVDFAVLNLLIYFTFITSGPWYSVFKTASFLIAMTHGYLWNKFWTFEASRSGVRVTEYGKYFVVAALGAIVNVGVASFIVNFIEPLRSITPEQWANIAAVAGSAVALIFTFVGFRGLVFRK